VVTTQPQERHDDAIVAGALTAEQRQAQANIVASSRMEGMDPTQVEIDAIGEVLAGRLSAADAIQRTATAVLGRSRPH
jgi:hypothetical protein